MPSVFTHAVAGAAISTFAPRRFRGPMLGLVLAVAAALPDADVIAFRFGIPYSHPLGHRGLSHSLPFALLTAVVISSWLTRGWFRRRFSSNLCVVVFLACASHGFLDAFTDAGLGVGFFVPFSDARFFFPWRPILTSPLGIDEFFAGGGLAILANEIAWVWLPIGAMVALTALARRVFGRDDPEKA